MFAAPLGILLLSPPKIEVMVFELSECPLANAYSSTLRRITKEFPSISFELVFEDEDLGFSAAIKHARSFDWNRGVRVDPKHALALRFGAKVSPEAFVVVDGKVAYQGRIDDRYPVPSIRRSKVGVHDLENALRRCLKGDTRFRKTQAIGCVLPV